MYIATGPRSKYDGEVRLCPPRAMQGDSNNISSISFGVVALYFTEYDSWRGVIQLPTDSNALLGGNEADAICRQMGYTGAIVGSAISKSATSYNFDDC